MNLYEIDAAILDCVDVETGEVFDEEKFESLSIDRDLKIENICLWIKNLTAEAEALKAEETAFAKRRKSAETKKEGLKKYIAGYLDGTPFRTTKVVVSFRRSESIEIDDWTLVPDEYLKIVVPEVDKTAVKKALKEGKRIEGVSLVEKQNIQIK